MLFDLDQSVLNCTMMRWKQRRLHEWIGRASGCFRSHIVRGWTLGVYAPRFSAQPPLLLYSCDQVFAGPVLALCSGSGECRFFLAEPELARRGERGRPVCKHFDVELEYWGHSCRSDALSKEGWHSMLFWRGVGKVLRMCMRCMLSGERRDCMGYISGRSAR